MQEQQQSDEIDLVALLKSLWLKRRWIIKTTLGFALMGLLVALISPKAYVAGASFVPQTGEQKLGGNLSGLAALAGVSLNHETGAQIPASLYPNVGESVSYKMELLHTPVQLETGEQILFSDYLKEHQKSGLAGLVLKYTIKPLLQLLRSKEENAVKDQVDGYFVVSEEEDELMETLDELLTIDFNEKEGIVGLHIRLSHPEVAAQIAARAVELLQQTVIAFKIKNAEKLLDYVTEQYALKQKEFLRIQKQLAEFKDSHKNIGTAVFENELSQLQTQYNLSFSLYKELALQKEQAQLQVNKDTPIFSVIQPVTQPHKKDRPKRALILLIWTFLGVVVSCGYTLLVPAIKKLKNEILT